MKKISLIIVAAMSLVLFFGCSKEKEVKPDYNGVGTVMTDLNKGDSLKGKIIKTKVTDVGPRIMGLRGYLGDKEEVKLVPDEQSKDFAKVGDIIYFKVSKASTLFDVAIVYGEVIKTEKGK